MVPDPAVARLSRLTVLLDWLCQSGRQQISSAALAELSGYSANTIRKDISYLGNPGAGGSGYRADALLRFIREGLHLTERVRTGIAGIGRLGSSLINYPGFVGQGIEMLAGFDNCINKIEQSSSPVPLFPSHEIAEVARRLRLELGILAVPKEAAQQTAQRMVDGGIRGILNFSPATLVLPPDICVRNLFVAEELISLASQIRKKETKPFNKE